MRAGKLDRQITIERLTTETDDYGTPVPSWSPLAVVRAQRIHASTEEFLRSFGASTEGAVVFRVRHIDGLTLADRVTDDGSVFDLKEIRELDRRQGLELRCLATGG